MGATRDANIMGVAIELMAGRALPLIHGCPVPQWHRRGAGRRGAGGGRAPEFVRVTCC